METDRKQLELLVVGDGLFESAHRHFNSFEVREKVNVSYSDSFTNSTSHLFS